MSAREDGYQAYKAGKSLEDNPYEEPNGGSYYNDYAQWEEGWFDAEVEHRNSVQGPGGKGTSGAR
jgi:ribosome modulation factor